MQTVEQVTVKCVECGEIFHISKNHLKWFEENNLQPFKRCEKCRKKDHKCIECGTMFRISENIKNGLRKKVWNHLRDVRGAAINEKIKERAKNG